MLTQLLQLRQPKTNPRYPPWPLWVSHGALSACWPLLSLSQFLSLTRFAVGPSPVVPSVLATHGRPLSVGHTTSLILSLSYIQPIQIYSSVISHSLTDPHAGHHRPPVLCLLLFFARLPFWMNFLMNFQFFGLDEFSIFFRLQGFDKLDGNHVLRIIDKFCPGKIFVGKFLREFLIF